MLDSEGFGGIRPIGCMGSSRVAWQALLQAGVLLTVQVYPPEMEPQSWLRLYLAKSYRLFTNRTVR